ncbi:MAG: DUF1439 domain-containing protein [Deltaproteobacteria bacterium]|nr:DUF1439 domain-containing protein [Deltaproteobacteria bacterium]
MKKLILTMALIMCSQAAIAFSYTLEISEDELQSRVSAMMPIEKKKFFITVVLSNPHIDLAVGNNEIGVFSHIEIIAPGGIKGTGNAKISGSLSYDSEKGEFYFENPKIVMLESEKIPPNLLPKVKDVVQVAVSQFLSVKPVYKLKDKNIKQKLVKAVLQSVRVESNLLLVELSLF